VDCIDLAESRDRWWAVMNAVMNFRVLKMRGISLLAEGCEPLRKNCWMELVRYKYYVCSLACA
jgi:hypothetical protein